MWQPALRRRGRACWNLGSQKCESLAMNSTCGDTESVEALAHSDEHLGRSADEHVAIENVRHQDPKNARSQRLERNLVPTPTHNVMDHTTALSHQLIQLRLKDDVFPSPSAIDEDDGVSLQWQLLQKRPQGRDADASGDKHDAREPPPHRGEDPVRTLHD